MSNNMDLGYEMFCYQCEQTANGKGCTKEGVCGKTAEVANLQDLLIFQIKGISYYAQKNRQKEIPVEKGIVSFVENALFTTLTNVNFDAENHVELLRESQKMKENLRQQVQNADCGIRVRISDGELLRKITLLMNRVIANADLMLPHPKIKHRDSAVVLDLQQQISDEMEQERPSEERIVALLCEIAGQLYKETNAKTQIAAQIARKRVSLMKPQDAFNAAYFSELIDAVSLYTGGGVVLHTKTETDICESEDKPNGSPENSETDSFRN